MTPSAPTKAQALMALAERGSYEHMAECSIHAAKALPTNALTANLWQFCNCGVEWRGHPVVRARAAASEGV